MVVDFRFRHSLSVDEEKCGSHTLKAEIPSLSAGTASANFGVISLCAKVDLRTRAVSAGVSGISSFPL